MCHSDAALAILTCVHCINLVQPNLVFLVVAMELPPVLMNKELLTEKSTDGDWRLRSMWAYQEKDMGDLLHKLFQWQLGGSGPEGQPSSRRCVLLCGGIGYVV